MHPEPPTCQYRSEPAILNFPCTLPPGYNTLFSILTLHSSYTTRKLPPPVSPTPAPTVSAASIRSAATHQQTLSVAGHLVANSPLSNSLAPATIHPFPPGHSSAHSGSRARPFNIVPGHTVVGKDWPDINGVPVLYSRLRPDLYSESLAQVASLQPPQSEEAEPELRRHDHSITADEVKTFIGQARRRVNLITSTAGASVAYNPYKPISIVRFPSTEADKPLISQRSIEEADPKKPQKTSKSGRKISLSDWLSPRKVWDKLSPRSPRSPRSPSAPDPPPIKYQIPPPGITSDISNVGKRHHGAFALRSPEEQMIGLKTSCKKALMCSKMPPRYQVFVPSMALDEEEIMAPPALPPLPEYVIEVHDPISTESNSEDEILPKSHFVSSLRPVEEEDGEGSESDDMEVVHKPWTAAVQEPWLPAEGDWRFGEGRVLGQLAAPAHEGAHLSVSRERQFSASTFSILSKSVSQRGHPAFGLQMQ